MRSILYNCTPIGLEAALGLLFALIQISLGSFEKAREKLTHTHTLVGPNEFGSTPYSMIAE